MKVAIIADLQPTGDRLDEFRHQLDAAIDVAIEESCPLLAIAGDVFEVGNIGDSHRPTGAILRAVCEPLRRFLLADSANEIIAVRGNHDTDNDGEDDALVALEVLDVERVTIIRRSGWWITRRGLAVAGLPWRWAGADPDTPPDAEAELEALLAEADSLPTPNPRLLLGHVQVLGARMNKLRTCDGGTWCISQEKLQELVVRHRIDRVALGDFHLRDVDLASPNKGGYIGNLWQQNFSHEGNPAGIEIWNTETGEAVFHELWEARRHSIWTVDRPEDVLGVLSVIMNAADFAKHRIWLKTDGFDLDRPTKVDITAMGIRVSAVNIKRVERTARLENAENLSLTDDRALLDGYVTTRNIELAEDERKRIDGALEEVIEENPKLDRGEKAERVATITPLRMRVCGIGKHTDTETLWEGLPPLVAVHGTNGAGKTTAVGALYAALYNEVPGYEGNLYDNLTAGGDGAALIEADFEVDGRRYRARREIIAGNSKNPEQERWLYDLDTGDIVAGPKDADYRAAVDRIVGDSQSALATWFMTANRDGDLTEIDPRERRALFGRFLGLARLDAVSDAAGEKARDAASRARQAAVGLPSIEEAEEKVKEAAEILHNSKNILEMAEYHTRCATEKYDAKLARFQQLQSDDSALTAKVQEEQRLEAERLRIEREIELAKAEIAMLRKQADGLAAACEARKGLVDARHEVKDLEIQLRAYERRLEWVRERQRLQTDVTARRDVIESLAQASGVTEETRALAASIDDIEREYREAISKNDVSLRAIEGWRERRGGIVLRLQRAGEELVRVDEQLKKKPETPFADQCEPCPFMKAWRDLPARKVEVERSIELIRLELREADARQPEVEVIDLEPIIRRGEAARAAQRAIEQAHQTEQRRAQAADALKAAESALQTHERGESPEAPNPTSQIVEARNRVDELTQKAAGEQAARMATEMLHSREQSLVNLRDRHGEVVASLARVRPEAETARAALASRESAKNAAQEELRQAQEHLASCRREVERTNRELGTARARYEEAGCRREEARRLRRDYDALLERQKAFEFLRRAFGREGIQPLLVEVAIPEMETVASELLTEAFEKPMALAFRTQSETRKGDLIEDFRIEVVDENGARDVRQFSGGEREVFSLLLRLAIGLWTARRRGASLESVFVDEAFNKLHPSFTARVVEILGRVSRRFRRIVLITPNPTVAAHFPAQVRVEPRLDGCAITYIGAHPASAREMPTPREMAGETEAFEVTNDLLEEVHS